MLLLLAVAPWVFGGEEPAFRAAALIAVAVITLLGGVRLWLGHRKGANDGPIVATLAGLFLLTAIQLVPMPPALLGIISPQSLALQQELRPTQPEVFLGEAAPLVEPPLPWRPISLAPFATQFLLLDLLVLFLFALVIRHQISGKATFRRLAWLGLINGSLLSLFALAQAQSSATNLVYWSVPTEGAVFGPFICRNHFPFFVVMCLGLSAGLLSTPAHRGPNAALLVSPLHDPRQLWVGGGMALMIVACFFSMSRGGVLAMVGSSAIIAALAWKLRTGASRFALAIPLGVALAVMLAVWLGTMPLEARLTTLSQADRLWDSRLTLWRNVLPHLKSFPFFGSGGGTFLYLEPMYRQTPGSGEPFDVEFAHNEYLEAAFEGGALRLALTIVLALAPCWVAWRLLRANPGTVSSIAVLGALWGLLAVALHSFFDFGVHLPAIALLATAAATHLTSLGAPTSRGPELSRPPRPYSRVLALLALPLALLLVWDASSILRADLHRRQAISLARSPRPDERIRQLMEWEAAVRSRPRDAALQQAAGQAYLDLHRDAQALRSRREQVVRACDTPLLLLPSPTLFNLATLEARRRAGEIVSMQQDAAARIAWLRPAARHMVEARNRSPVLFRAQQGLAELTRVLSHADPAEIYLERAVKLQPSEPNVWFELGWEYLNAEKLDQCRTAWRASLEMSDAFLIPILDRSIQVWNLSEVRELLPNRPETWLAAADHLLPDERRRDERAPFLKRALTLMKSGPGDNAASVVRLAGVQRQLGLNAEAESSYREAIRRANSRIEWRLEFARFLRQIGRLDDARNELLAMLERVPDHGEARETLLIVNRELQLRDGRN